MVIGNKNIFIYLAIAVLSISCIFSLQPGEPNNSRQGSQEQVYTFVHKTHSYFYFEGL